MNSPNNSMPGLDNLWTQGDAVTHGVALLLLAMSLASWCVIIAKAWQLLRLQRAARQITQGFWLTHSIDDAIAQLAPDSPFAQLARAGKQAQRHHHEHERLRDEQLSLSDWVTMNLRQGIDEAQGRLQAGMAVLASVGSSAPFVGLFGTVWGIYHALMAISLSGQVSLDKVAGPVGESLIMTAFGLAVAIPASFGYNALVRGNKTVGAQLNKFGFDLHALLAAGQRTGAMQAPAQPAPLAPVLAMAGAR